MDETGDNIKTHYVTDFSPAEYHKRIVNRDGGKFKKEDDFFISSMVEIFDNPQLKGSRLLDIGSGPTVHNIAPACKRFSHIILSDFVDVNIKELRKWLNGEKDALDWSRFLENVAKAQGYIDPEAGRLEIETLIRKNVKAVVHCDVLADRIVPEEYEVPYDVVLTSLTLEAASEDYVTFRSCLQKVNRLIKLNGHLVMKGFLLGSPWKTGEQEFPYLKLSRANIQQALEEAGFGQIDWKILPKVDHDYSYEFEACYCLCCVKQSDINV